MKKLVGLLIVTGMILTGCSSDDEVGMATIQVSLVDAPAEYQAVNIEILEVRINSSADTSWVALESASTGIFDVLKLTNGEEVFLGEVELPEGELSQVRLLLGDNNTLTIDGETVDLKVPSGSQSGLKLNVNANISAGVTYKLVLDFDASKSIVKAGNSGKYNLKPVIRAAMEAQTGAISGSISPAEAEAIIYAISGTDSVSSYPDGSGSFIIRALDAGTYDVTAVISDTAMYQNGIIEGVNVEIGAVQDIGTLDLSK